MQNEFIMRRLVQAKNRNQRRERRLLLEVMSMHAGEKFAFKITFRTIHTSCSTAVKRQIIPDLWGHEQKMLCQP